MAFALLIDNGFCRTSREIIIDVPENKNADFWNEFMDWAELEFGLGHEDVEEGLRFGFQFLHGEEIWKKPLFNLALQVGNSCRMSKKQVEQALRQLLTTWESVRSREGRYYC